MNQDLTQMCRAKETIILNLQQELNASIRMLQNTEIEESGRRGKETAPLRVGSGILQPCSKKAIERHLKKGPTLEKKQQFQLQERLSQEDSLEGHSDGGSSVGSQDMKRGSQLAESISSEKKNPLPKSISVRANPNVPVSVVPKKSSEKKGGKEKKAAAEVGKILCEL